MSKKRKKWPENCVWPAPIDPYNGGEPYDPDMYLDYNNDELNEMMEIKEYFDELVEEEVLDDEYHLMDAGHEWIPEKGDCYWYEDSFDMEAWHDDFECMMNQYYIPCTDIQNDPVCMIREITGYTFVNENLLRQAFTRRAFAIEYGLDGCNEELEFLGDSVLNMMVTHAMVDQYAELDAGRTEAPFYSPYDEGFLTRYRSTFICKEHLAARATELGLDRFILYGSSENESDSAKEDVMEALIAAVALDSKWNYEVIEQVVEKIVSLQIQRPNSQLKKSYYDIFNAWHQRKYGVMPEYYVYKKSEGNYECAVKYSASVPMNCVGQGRTRSLARDDAAFLAYRIMYNNGLWLDLSEADMEPDLDRSINQLQELYQKKYLEEAPEYVFEEGIDGTWHCDCICCGLSGFGRGESKTKAKKKAAYGLLVLLFKGSGITKEEWERKMYREFL